MTIQQILTIVIAIVIFVALPIYGIVSTCIWLKAKPSERPERRGGGGGVFIELDRLIQPTVEHRIEAQQRVVKQDASPHSFLSELPHMKFYGTMVSRQVAFDLSGEKYYVNRSLRRYSRPSQAA